MIVTVRALQCLECEECGEQQEIRRKVLRDPDAMLAQVEAMREEHKPCREFKGNPERARLEREFRLKVREEMAELKAKERTCRTSRSS